MTEHREVRRAIRWIRRIAAGDRPALRQLYELYHPSLLRFAQRMLGNTEEAEEVVQDVFVKVWHQASGYDPERSTPLGWLFMMTRSQSVDRLRKRMRALKIQAVGEQNAGYEELTSDEAMESFERMINEDWVEHLLGGLPEGQRRCLELTLLQGFTQAEAANRLDRPLGTVKSEVRRGLARLRQILEGVS